MDYHILMDKILDLSIKNVEVNTKNNIDQYCLILNNLHNKYNLLYANKPSKIFIKKYREWEKELKDTKESIYNTLKIIEEELKTLDKN